MYWTLGANATAYESLTVNGVPQFQAANPAAGVANGTTITAQWLSDVQGELLNIVLAAGITPAEATPTQVLQGLNRLFGGNLGGTGGAATLTQDQMGLIELTGSATYTTTLPSPVSTVIPLNLVWNASSAPQTLATPAGNFIAPGGSGSATMTLALEQMVLIRSDGANYVVSPPLNGGFATAANKTGSRALGTVYTNSSNRPTAVTVYADTASSSAGQLSAFIGGAQVAQQSATGASGLYVSITVVVPPGASYEFTGTNMSLVNWEEIS